MASHHLTIAKATFAASLLRPDVTKISRDEIPSFYNFLETTVLKCTPFNVQVCWNSKTNFRAVVKLTEPS
jgi:hypothetical protein